jgi:ribonucleoside-triphosphate reductase (formate)
MIFQEIDSVEQTASGGNIYNMEQIPGESMAVRLAEIDKILGYNPSEHKLYSNQYIPLTQKASIYDRFRIQGEIDGYTSGGAILHLNVDDDKPLSSVQFGKLIKAAKDSGTVYFAVNYAYSECYSGHISVGMSDECPVCGKEIAKRYSRVVGFITPVSSWNSVRRDYEFKNRYFYRNGEITAEETYDTAAG